MLFTARGISLRTLRIPSYKILKDKSCHALIRLGIGFNNICDPTKHVSTSLILRMVLLEWMVVMV